MPRGTPKYANDAGRPLTDEGRAKLRAVARAMKVMKLRFDAILSSPYKRARQTAELVATKLNTKQKVKYTSHLAPTGKIQDLVRLLDELRPRPRNILLVGHEPYLSSFASVLLTGEPGLAIKLKKGGVAKLSMETPHASARAELEWLLTPAQMKRMK